MTEDCVVMEPQWLSLFILQLGYQSTPPDEPVRVVGGRSDPAGAVGTTTLGFASGGVQRKYRMERMIVSNL